MEQDFIIVSAVMEQDDEAKVSVDACMSKLLTYGERTAGLIGTGEALFDAPERWKVDGSICRAIGATRHVPCTISQSLEKDLLKIVGQTNGWIRLKLCGPMYREQVLLL